MYAKQNKREKFINETIAHRNDVGTLMVRLACELIDRAYHHDESKIQEPELSLFSEVLDKVKRCDYGTECYNENLSILEKANKTHYERNPHHPEHFEQGIGGMDLVDLIEMLCDWMDAAKSQAKTGDIVEEKIVEGIHINRGRFDMSIDLTSILINTVQNFKNYDNNKKQSL